MAKEMPIYGHPIMMLAHRTYGQELKPLHTPKDPLKVLVSLKIDYVPLWARRPHNLDPLPTPPKSEISLPMVAESLIPELIATIRRHERRFGYRIARIAIGARPADTEQIPALHTIWGAQGVH